jgi:hypothetical protein
MIELVRVSLLIFDRCPGVQADWKIVASRERSQEFHEKTEEEW